MKKEHSLLRWNQDRICKLYKDLKERGEQDTVALH